MIYIIAVKNQGTLKTENHYIWTAVNNTNSRSLETLFQNGSVANPVAMVTMEVSFLLRYRNIISLNKLYILG